MVYIVLGMHKSGTTLISKILHESGINMGFFNSNVSYDDGNKYERMETLITNISLLNIKYKEPSIGISKTIINESGISKLLISYIQKLVGDLNSQFMAWGFKDPRTCLTYRIWEKQIPDHKMIIVVRSPLEIIEHYDKKEKLFYLRRMWRIWKVLDAWYLHNFQILQCLKNTKNGFIVIEYGEFINSQKLFKKLSEFVGLELKDLRNKQLYRSKYKSSSGINLLIIIQKYLFQRDIHFLYKNLKNYSEI